MAVSPTLVWFRNDLRLGDNPALAKALSRKGPVIPVYIWGPAEEAPWAPGGASRYWLHQSLAHLQADIARKGGALIVRRGGALDVLRRLIAETGAGAVYWNRRYEPAVIARDRAVKAGLREDGIEAESFNASLLFEPWDVTNKSGQPFQVFTPFWKHCLGREAPPAPLPAPKAIPGPARPPASETLESLALEPAIDWAGGIREAWNFGERAAEEALGRFLEEALGRYGKGRDCPAEMATSRMSPYLHFGEIGPRQIWRAANAAIAATGDEANGAKFLSEVGWREFSHHLLYHFPETPATALRAPFRSFPWSDDGAALVRWQRGRTGYPLVDAGMRELWHTGWMHNRVRMIAASFLTKDLLIPWQRGAAWFWDTLVDADLANNTQGWQWTAGCGADAAPYFRVFNPVSQGEKFDPAAHYIRRWVPELAGLPDAFVHKPWEAGAETLRRAGVVLGETYPERMVDHGEARERALAAYGSMKGRV